MGIFFRQAGKGIHNYCQGWNYEKHISHLTQWAFGLIHAHECRFSIQSVHTAVLCPWIVVFIVLENTSPSHSFQRCFVYIQNLLQVLYMGVAHCTPHWSPYDRDWMFLGICQEYQAGTNINRNFSSSLHWQILLFCCFLVI